MTSEKKPELEAPVFSQAEHKNVNVEESNSVGDTEGDIVVGAIEQEKTTQTTQGIEVTASNKPSRPASEKSRNYSSFTTWEKRFIVFTATIAAMFSPFTAQIYFPALNTLAKDLHVTNAKINLTITTYMVFSPSFTFPSQNF